MKLFLRTVGGSRHELFIDAETTVKQLQDLAAEHLSSQPEKVKLIFRSKALEPSNNIEHYSMSEGDTLTVVLLKVFSSGLRPKSSRFKDRNRTETSTANQTYETRR